MCFFYAPMIHNIYDDSKDWHVFLGQFEPRVLVKKR
jgi:hypothetical protein